MDSTNPFGDALAPEGNPFGDAPAPTPASSPAMMAQAMASGQGDQPSINDVQGSASTTATPVAPATATSPTQNQPAQPAQPQTTADRARQQALTPPNPNENAIPPTLSPNPPAPQVPPAAPSNLDQTFGIMANQFSPQEVSKEIGAPDSSDVSGGADSTAQPAINNLHDLNQYGYEQEGRLRRYVGDRIKEGFNAVNDFGNSLDDPKVLKAIPSAINQAVVAGENSAGIGAAQNVEELAKAEQNQLEPGDVSDPISAMVNGPIGYLATQYVSDASQHIAKWLERDTEDFKEKQSEETRAILSSNRNVAGAVATVGTMGTQLLTTAAAGRLLGNPVEFFAGRQLELASELPGAKGAIARQLLIRSRATARSNIDNVAQIATVAGLNAFEVQQRYAEKTPEEIAALSPEYKARIEAAKTEEEKKQIVEFAAQRAADKTYVSSLVIGIAAGRIHSEAHPVMAGVASGAAFGGGTVASTNYGLREVDKKQPLTEGALSAAMFWGAVSGMASKAHETDFGGVDEKTVAQIAKTRALQLKTRAGMKDVTPEQREEMLKRAELIQHHLSNSNIEKAAFAARMTNADIAERDQSPSGAKPVEEAVKDAIKNYINSANSNNQQQRIQRVRAIRLWATKGGKRTPSEVLSALHETIADDKLPDYIEEGSPNEQDQVSEGSVPGGAQAETRSGERVSPVEGGHGAAEESQAGAHGQESGEAGEVTPRAASVANQLKEAGIEAPVSRDGRVTVAPDNPNGHVATTLAAHDAAESPKNDYAPPTDGQKVNGNYRKGKTLFPSPQGDVKVNIENPAGSVRRSVEGQPSWERKVTEHYGYIPGTHGADGDPLDVVVGRHAHDDSLPVFVVHQTDPATGKFDELKVVMGAKTEGQARQMYLNQYPRQMHGQLIAGTPKIVRMSRGQFTDWLAVGDHATPVSPISKQPMMKLQERGELTSHFDDTADFDSLDAKVDDLNSRLGVQLTVNRSGTGYDVAGDIPKAVLPSIHKALKGVSGHEQTQFNHVDAGKVFAGRSRQRGTRVPASAGQLDVGKRAGGQQYPVPESGDRQEGEAGPAEAPAPRWLNKPKSDAPIFQRKQGKHPSSVVAVHYSAKHGLTELDPSMSGSATPERGRLLKAAGAKAGVLDQRVHFYVRESDALPQKERIVGGEHPAAYEVRLNNLYDVAADPDGIIERAELAGKGNDHDAIVKAILKAGYDGTVHRGVANDTPVATVFGKGKIPVKHVRPQPKFMFLGRHAKTADIEKLEKAKAMHAEGKEREAHAETGWHKGKDGRYRFEISDKDIRVSDDFDELDDGESMPLEKAMPHPELFKAYPELGKVKIIKDESMGGDEAFTDPTKNEIHLGSAWKYNEESIDQVLKHEVQHLVQLHEGFARGGSPGEFMVQVRQQLTELAKKHDEAIARMEEAEEKGDKEAFEAAKKEAEEIDQLGSSIFRENNIQSHAKYQRLAGEVEARNTSKRSEMTDAERRATHPMDMETTYKGEAIPREEQIVKYANESDMNIADSKRAGVAQETHLAAEVAPNPDNVELTREWEAMSMADRAAVTRRVGSEVVSRVAKILGVDKGKIINAVGGYEGHINPNLLTRYRRGTMSIEQARAFASGLGKALDQKSVVLVDPRASGDAGVIRVTLPRDVTPEDARVVMDAISDTGMDGFTAKGRNLDILHFGDAKDDDAMGMRVHAALDKIDSLDGFTVTTGRSKSELIGSDDYDGHLSGLRSQAGGEVHAGLRGVRDWAQAEVGREIEARTGAGKAEYANAIEQRFADKVGVGRKADGSYGVVDPAKYRKTVEAYKAIPDTHDGKIISADVARELSDDYLKDRSLSGEVHEVASAFVKEYFKDKLAEPHDPGSYAMMTAGGTGAGKTTALEGQFASMENNADFVYDTNMNTLSSADAKIKAIMDSGRRVKVAYVYRDPVEALENGALKRAERQKAEFGTGRTVPLNVHAETHIGALKTVQALEAKYAHDPRFDLQVLDNTNGNGNVSLTTLDNASRMMNNHVDLEGDLRMSLDKALRDSRISKETYNGFRKVYKDEAARKAGVREEGGIDDSRAGEAGEGKRGIRRDHGEVAEPRDQARSADQVAAHHDELAAHAAKITSGWKGAPDVQAVKADGEGLPDGLRAHMDQAVPEQHVPAMYYGGKVYVFPHNIVNKADLELALVHEVNGHFGLRHTFGDDLPNLLSDIHDSIKDLPAYRELAARYRKAYAGLTRQQFDHAITEEYLSNRAELQTNPGVIAKLVAFVRQWGRQHGMVRQWSDNDVTALMHRVAQNVRQGRTSRFGYPAPTTTFSGERGAATSTYEGAAGTGSIDSLYDGGRVLRVDGLTARLDRLLTEHGTGLDISDLDYAEPKRLEAVPRFAGEEGKGFVVWPEGMDAKALDDAGVPHEELVGRLVSPAVASTDTTPRLSMRRPGSLSKDKDLQDRIDRTIEGSESEMTPWDRMQMIGRQLFAKENREQAKANIMQSNVDRFYAIGKLERKSNDGYLFDASESAFKMAHMSQHIQQVMGAVMRDGIPVYKDGAFQAVPGRKGWFDLLSPLYQHHDPGMARAFNFYLGTRRAERLLGEVNADGSPRERNFTAEDVAKGKELEAKYPWFKDVADDVQQFNHDLLDLAVERGNMSRETADMWKENFYVPFYRAMEEEGAESAARRAFGGLKVTSKYLSGGGKIDMPLDSMLNNTTVILDKIYKNEAVRRSIAEAVNAGIARPIGMAADPKQFSVKQIEDRLEKAGLFVGQQANAKRGAKLTLTDDQRAQYVKLLDIHPPMGENVVFAMYGGKARYYEVDDPIVRRAIGNITHEKALNRWAKVILHTPSRILRTLTVENPSFWVRHLERQWLDAKLQSGYDVQLLRRAASSAVDVYTNGPMLRKLSMAGAGGNEYYNVNFAHEEMRALGKHATVLDNLHKMRMAYEKVGFVADQMNRVSLARNVLDRGGSVAEAAWQAQDLLNFGMHGDNVATRYLMQAVPFLNARLQGAYRIVRGATGRDVTKQVATQIGGSLAKRFLYKGLLLTAASLALEAHNQGDPRYEKLTDEQKDLYYNFFIGDMHYAIPKPFELGAIFSTLPERLGRLVSGRDNAREFWESVARVTEATMRLDPTDIALVTPIWEDEVNKDKLTQRPILSDRYADVEPSEQYNAFTSPVVKAVAQHMPGFAPDVLRSPIRLQHLLRGYFSTVGNYAISSADVMARMFGSDNAAPSSDSPLGAAGGKMFGSMVSRSSADRRNHAEDVFWDDYHKMMVVARTVKQMKDNNDIERLNRYAASNAGYLAYKSSLTALHDKLMLMHKAELHIYTDSEMTADEKRDALLDIIKAKDELLRQNEELIQGANNL